MASAPWYLAQKPGLKHQKAWGPGEKDGGRWYERGIKTFQATKFRKGACENCGAMTHKRKDCVCLLYTSPSPRDKRQSRMPSSA